jgi:DNA topoisomerase-1
MAKNLVIVESPAKWKTIEKFLWPDFQVVASMWHIRDLPIKTLWIDIENGFVPEYWINEDKIKTVNNLKKLAKSANEVWIATDEDREWEAIWWHLCAILNIDPDKTKRIVFHEITKKAITHAVENPKTLDMWLVDAQQARRLLDRLVWYKVSPVLWKKIRKWLSAGRVQSVAVKLIVEKEREIIAFKPEESWKISIELTHLSKSKFKTTLSKINDKVKKLSSRADVEKVLATLFDNITSLKESENKKWNTLLSWNTEIDFKLIDSLKKDSIRKPWAPFTTSTLQQEWARKFGFPVKQTMMVAQKLYEWMDLWNWERQGLITYMRTDSMNLSDLAKSDAKKVIDSKFWKEYHKARSFKTKSAWAQEAHEAIRPTDLSRTPESLASVLDPQQLKLYTLIWKRTLASQMSDAIVEVTTFTFSPEKAKNQTWITKWEVIKFDWFMKLYIEWTDDENDEEDENTTLPSINIWEVLPGNNLEANQWFSRPPARYTEASLVKKLEWEGIGRPSTYAPTISTIIDRWYVEKFEKKYLKPTEVAFTVTDFLEEYFKKMMEYKFTKDVEADFDNVAEWKVKFQDMLSKFWEDTLKKDLEHAWANAEKVIEYVGKKCPKCSKELIYRHSKAGKFVWCSWFPECDFIDQPEEEKNLLDELKAKFEWKPCPNWIEWTIVVKTGRFWPFLASSEYPKVKRIWKIKDKKEELLEIILQEKGLLIDEESWEEMVLKNSRRWPFLAAKNYPAVKIAKNIPKEVWDIVNAKIAEQNEEESNEES